MIGKDHLLRMVGDHLAAHPDDTVIVTKDGTEDGLPLEGYGDDEPDYDDPDDHTAADAYEADYWARSE